MSDGAAVKFGSRTIATPEVRAIAQKYGPAAIKELARIAGLVKTSHGRPLGASTNDTVRRAALDSILDRAYGKATQPMQHSVDEGLEDLLRRIGREA